MSVKTLAHGATFAISSGFGFKPNQYVKDNGSLVLERVPVFRSGTFRDSNGIQNTWEKLHIDQMIANYEHLRDNGIFADVPVRDGHAGWLLSGLPGIGQVVGYHLNIWTENLESPVDGQSYDYMLADLEITDPAAAAKIANGTWRNRSAEINGYLTNAEAEFWPVYMGVAYVDIPAVEGLKFSSTNGYDRQSYVFLEKETGVTTNPPGQPAPSTAAAPLLGVPSAPQSFSINGVATTDVVAVQAHITALELFRSEANEANRKNFVNGLAVAGKIPATQIDALVAFSATLSAEQYAAWTKMYEAAPTVPGLANHAGGVTNPGNVAQQQSDPAAVALEVAKASVRQHRLAGTPVEQIKETRSYKALVAAGQTPEL